MSNDQIAKPLILEIEGDHYEFTPLKISDITGAATDYFRMAPVAELLAQKDAFDPEVFDQMMIDVKEDIKNIELGTSRFSEELAKPRNLFYMFWLSLRKKHPNIKKKQFDEMVHNDVHVASQLLNNLGRIIAIADSSPKSEEQDGEGTRQNKEGTKKKIVPST